MSICHVRVGLCRKNSRERLAPVVGVLVEAPAAGEDDERHLGVAEDRELVRLLQETVAALAESDLPVRRVLDALDLDPPSPHLLGSPPCRSRSRSRARPWGRRLLYLGSATQNFSDTDQKLYHRENRWIYITKTDGLYLWLGCKYTGFSCAATSWTLLWR